MTKKIGRNDPCPCGSGAKYKNCCQKLPGVKRKIKATLLSGAAKSEMGRESLMPDLLKRRFGGAIAAANEEGTPPKLEEQKEKGESDAGEK